MNYEPPTIESHPPIAAPFVLGGPSSLPVSATWTDQPEEESA
jgi:hypothetical protein